MRQLVFASKWIGAQCIDFLLEQFPDDEYTFIVCEPEADVVIEVLNRRKQPYMRFGVDSLNVVRGMDAGHYDWLLNLWGGYIFKHDTLSRVRNSLNIHPAYLPYCRGRDPIVWAIRYGFPAGVTLHTINHEVDEGAIWYREEVPYKLPIRGIDLYDRVIERCLGAFVERWAAIREGSILPLTQSEYQQPQVCYTFKRRDLYVDQCIDVDQNLVAREVVLRLLAHDFEPSYSSKIIIEGKSYNAVISLVPSCDPKT